MHAGIYAMPRVVEAWQLGRCLQDGTWGPRVETQVSFPFIKETGR